MFVLGLAEKFNRRSEKLYPKVRTKLRKNSRYKKKKIVQTVNLHDSETVFYDSETVFYDSETFFTILRLAFLRC